jgi:hypothetical protein
MRLGCVFLLLSSQTTPRVDWFEIGVLGIAKPKWRSRDVAVGVLGFLRKKLED